LSLLRGVSPLRRVVLKLFFPLPSGHQRLHFLLQLVLLVHERRVISPPRFLLLLIVYDLLHLFALSRVASQSVSLLRVVLKHLSLGLLRGGLIWVAKLLLEVRLHLRFVYAAVAAWRAISICLGAVWVQNRVHPQVSFVSLLHRRGASLLSFGGGFCSGAFAIALVWLQERFGSHILALVQGQEFALKFVKLKQHLQLQVLAVYVRLSLFVLNV